MAYDATSDTGFAARPPAAAVKHLQYPFTTTEGAAPRVFWGTGSPEGVVTALVGDAYRRTDGTPALYVKTSGVGNTGWSAMVTSDGAYDTIAELTPGAGVTIDGVLCKDGGVTLTGALTAGGASQVMVTDASSGANIILRGLGANNDLFLNFTRRIEMQHASVTYWVFDGTTSPPHFRPNSTNAYDIGNGANLVRELHLGTAIKGALGVQVLSAVQKSGWTVPTGTADRTTFATFAGQTITSPPTQAEVQAIDDHVVILSQHYKALIDDLHATGSGHGLIGG
jgi:hypothetical protein